MVGVDTDREKGVNVLHRTLTLDMGDDHGLAIGSGPAKITKVISVVVAPTGEPALVALDVANGRSLCETPARFHTNLFRSLFRGLRAFRIRKIAKNFAPLDRLRNFAEFSHGLGGERAYKSRPGNDRS
jgi:hypothetical protein